MSVTRFASFALLCAVALSACQTFSTESSADSSTPLAGAKDRFALIYQPARRGAIEPCGCAFIPRGGIAREWHQRRKWATEKIPTLSLQADNAFLPVPFIPENVDYYRRKAALVAQAMHDFHIDVFSPSRDDFALGRPTAEEWRKASGANWISANLFDKKSGERILPALHETTLAGHAVRVVGISSCQGGPGYKDEPSITCRPPVEALRDVLKPGLSPALTVLIGTLQPKERLQIRDTYPQIKIVFNSDDENIEEAVVQEDAGHLYTNPLERTMQLIRIVFSGPETAANLYSSVNTPISMQRADNMRVLVYQEEQDLKKKQSPARRADLKNQLERHRRALEGAKQVAYLTRNGALEYDAVTQSLDDTTEPGKNDANPMVKLFEKFKQENHDYLLRAEAAGEND